ncbi:MAG: DUF4411 family protein [Selenomonas sp.]|nr:DUF4411 family protein [Selenomonas sp.]
MDTNTFITAKNTFYAYDIVPSFWSTLLGMFKTGKVKIPDICQQVGVKYVNLYDMMRTVGIKI